VTVAALTMTLDEELAAIVRGELRTCLVCGEQVEVEDERAECPSCGSVLEEPREPGPDQLALM
jgi:hypothetical protein